MFSGGLEGRQSKLVISCNAGAAQPTFSALGETGAGTKIYVRWEMGEKGVEARRGEARRWRKWMSVCFVVAGEAMGV